MTKQAPKYLLIIYYLLIANPLLAQEASTKINQSFESQAHPLVLSNLPDTTVIMSPFTTAFIDYNANVSLDSIKILWQQGHFVPLENLDYPPKFESGAYHYWLQFQIENKTEDTLNLVFRLPRLDSSFCYQIIEGQLTKTILFGNKVNMSDMQSFDLPIFSSHSMPLQILPFQKNQVYIKTFDDLYLTTPLTPLVESLPVFYKNKVDVNFSLIFTNGIFLGILVFVSLFSFFQYFQNNDKAYIFYALYVGLLFFSFWIIFDDDNGVFKVLYKLRLDLYYIFVPNLISIYAAYTLFVYYFINEKKQYPFITKLTKILLSIFAIYFVFTILVSCLIHVRWSWIIHYYFRGIISIFAILLLGFLWKLRTPLALYLFFGTFCLVVLSLLAPILLSLTLKEKGLWGTDYTYILAKLGIIVELLFFSIGLGYKRYLADQDKMKAQQETKELENLKAFTSTFYTNITHEFRTPLTVILGMTDQLKTEAKQQEWKKAAQPLNMIQRNSQNLLQLVNEMLDLTKLESGHLELELAQGDVIPFVKYISESFQSLAEKDEIKLTIYSEVEDLVMDFDSAKLATIVSNLLSNAIKFTPKNGKVIIHLNQIVSVHQSFFFIKIKDTGKGISKEEMPHVFNRFYQADNSAVRQYEGTGIGLALTKELVELMGGTIEVKSELGKGSEFTVQLPISRNASLVEKNQTIKLSSKTALNDKERTSKNTTNINNDLPLVLIIEDNMDVAIYLQTCLEGQYQSLHAENGNIGIAMALEHIPDLIISDVMMPGKDGFEVCQTLKTDERSNHIPIIMLTAKATLQDRLSGLSHGADVYLSKPFEKEELLIHLNNLLEVRRTLQKKYSEQLIVSTDTPIPVEKPVLEEDPFIKKARGIILADLENEKLSIDDFAQQLFLSRSQLHRKLKAITGMSASIFMRQVRLKEAKKLLQSTDLSISEVAYQVGFKSPVYFSQVFKETYGMSPSELRK